MPSLSKQRLVGLFAALTAASCASIAPANPAYLPPEALLQDCTSVTVDASTNGALANSVRRLREALGACTDDKRALREWAAAQ